MNFFNAGYSCLPTQDSIPIPLRRFLSLIYRDRLAISYLDHAHNRLLDLLRLPPLIPLGTRIGPRLALDYAAPKQLGELLTHLLSAAGNPRLMTPQLIATLCEHAAGNYRVLCHMSAELLAEGLRRQATQLDEKLYMEVFSLSSRSRSRNDARKIAG